MAAGVGVEVAVCGPIDSAVATAVAVFVGTGVGLGAGNSTAVEVGTLVAVGIGVGVGEGSAVESAVAAVLEAARPDSVVGEAEISLGVLVELSPGGIAVAACRSLSSMDAAMGAIVVADFGVVLIEIALGEATRTGVAVAAPSATLAAGAAPHAGSVAAQNSSATIRNSFIKS